jgi:hypothetical protein
MTININALNGITVNELDSSVPLTSGNGLTINGGGSYTTSPNSFGNLSSYDNWTGGPALNAPAPGDVTQYNLTVADATHGIIQYTFNTGDGSTNPTVGGIGAEVVAYNATGVLVETITGYQPGNTTFNLTGTYLEFGSVDLSQFEAGYAGPPGAALVFGQTGASTFLGIGGTAVPEPSTVLLMPVLVVALMICRIPSVRSRLRAYMGGQNVSAGAF